MFKRLLADKFLILALPVFIFALISTVHAQEAPGTKPPPPPLPTPAGRMCTVNMEIISYNSDNHRMIAEINSSHAGTMVVAIVSKDPITGASIKTRQVYEVAGPISKMEIIEGFPQLGEIDIIFSNFPYNKKVKMCSVKVEKVWTGLPGLWEGFWKIEQAFFLSEENPEED